MLDVANKRWVTKAELAKRYSVSERTIANWMAKRIIPFLKFPGRCVRFDTDATDAAIHQFSVNFRRHI